VYFCFGIIVRAQHLTIGTYKSHFAKTIREESIKFNLCLIIFDMVEHSILSMGVSLPKLFEKRIKIN